jgi:hypothetical protein
VASTTFWSKYIDPLLGQLRDAGVGCHIGGVFVGVVGYADDLLLLAPSRDAAQKMLKTCELFAEKHNIRFSTDEDPKKSKSKVIHVVGPRGGAITKPAPLVLCGRPLPWVERAEHLGHTLHQDGTMSQDCKQKRAQFIDQSVKMRETFGFAHPHEQIVAIEKYCTAAYGSNLWDLNSQEARMFLSAWKTGHKLAWGVDRRCRTYLVQEVLAPHVPSLEAGLLSKFHGFFLSLLQSPSHEVSVVARLAARDIRSNLGSNLELLVKKSKLDPWVATRQEVRAALAATGQVEVPAQDAWRVTYLQRLLPQKLEAHYKCEKEEEERLITLINSLVIN